ncbi:MAG: hypothetical protein LUF25_01250 [Phascolarctobacterium sp.]|nr:hypothetical protein [Phascolarctobacterium sp.]MCD8175034.1 hypothetical protein [Phascolarctobacterium sp.]
MKKSLLIFIMTCLIACISSAVSAAFSPGQRTYRLLGDILNSDRHPVHLVVVQKLDMQEIMTEEAYSKLTDAQKVRINRTEYNEKNGINAERVTTTDAVGKVLRDQSSFVKGGYWYTIDYVNRTYDRLPELQGMSPAFAETLISWFVNRPVMGNDPATGYDYDMVTKGEGTLYFYFEKDTDIWKGYKERTLPMFTVVECSNEVDADNAFALPPADFKQVANQNMRDFANAVFKKH